MSQRLFLVAEQRESCGRPDAAPRLAESRAKLPLDHPKGRISTGECDTAAPVSAGAECCAG